MTQNMKATHTANANSGKSIDLINSRWTYISFRACAALSILALMRGSLLVGVTKRVPEYCILGVARGVDAEPSVTGLVLLPYATRISLRTG